ncbi:MAG: rhomboid family intramembrane serine protease [Ekhidna sp.]
MNENNPQKERIFPFVWPWKGANNQRLSVGELVKVKTFSIFYLIAIWTVIAILGFASTRNCEGTWQLALQCEYAFWVKNLTETPLIFFRNLFTTPFLHNGLDHILFVSVLGFLLIVQSHEAVFGSKRTALMFLSSYVTVAPFFAVFYTVGIDFFPDSEFMQFAFVRNWLGGSIGMFQVYGALATQSRKPWIMLSVPVIFEIFNLTVLGIDLHISLMHVMASFLGFGISYWFVKR